MNLGKTKAKRYARNAKSFVSKGQESISQGLLRKKGMGALAC
jgi:hypothetical protein